MLLSGENGGFRNETGRTCITCAPEILVSGNPDETNTSEHVATYKIAGAAGSLALPLLNLHCPLVCAAPALNRQRQRRRNRSPKTSDAVVKLDGRSDEWIHESLQRSDRATDKMRGKVATACKLSGV